MHGSIAQKCKRRKRPAQGTLGVVLVVLLTVALMIAGLMLATWWVEAHPIRCDAACRAARDRQWKAMSQ